jgi:hypothetical protein
MSGIFNKPMLYFVVGNFVGAIVIQVSFMAGCLLIAGAIGLLDQLTDEKTK